MRDRCIRKVTVMFKRWYNGPRLAFRKSEFVISTRADDFTRLCCGKTFEAECYYQVSAASGCLFFDGPFTVQIKFRSKMPLFLLDKFPITFLSVGTRQKALAIAE